MRVADLLLVGGGHAHLHVLERLLAQPRRSLRVVLVVDDAASVYSGMVPGLLAGRYSHGAVRLPVADLARRAGVDVRVARATGIDPRRRRVTLGDGTTVGFGLLSLNVGASVAGLGLPGVREHALPTRPMGAFTERLSAKLDPSARPPRHVVVVGGGAGGVELAFAVRARLGKGAGAPTVTVVHGGPEILEGGAPALIRRVHRNARRMGIAFRRGRRADAVERDALQLDGGECVPADLVIWATGAVGHPFLRDSGLPVDDRGFLLVRPTLQVLDDDQILAAGDCAVPLDRPALPRAGVHAVRQGPYLAGNLLALLDGGPLRAYVPQEDALVLLNLGNGAAVGSKWRRACEGRSVMVWKDWIDRRFVRRFSPASEG